MKNFVSFKLAKKLRKKGFKEKCLAFYITEEDLRYNYDSHISNMETYFSHNSFNNIWHKDLYDAPSIENVLKWIRKEKGLHLESTASAFGYSYIISKTPEFGGTDIKFSEFDGPNDGGAWDDYDDCALAAIDYVLDNLI